MLRGFGGDRFCVVAQYLVRQTFLGLDDVYSVFRVADGCIVDKHITWSLGLRIY